MNQGFDILTKIIFKPLQDQNGQLAIFVALIFQVLFVFFAMAINVGLLVHDKINLQNSVDLAAYYAAQKQAEVLNAIAHENYQIRQSWKLLSWRYRVVGTMGLTNHPVNTGNLTETLYADAEIPSVCVTYRPNWRDLAGENENLCKRKNTRIPPLPQVPVIAPFLGINLTISALSTQLRAQFDASCQKHGAHNWWYAMSILTAFRFDQANRKSTIFALAENLSTSGGMDFFDINGGSVSVGVTKVVEKNLTHENRQSLGGRVQVLNSLNGVDRRQWLPEIQINPTLVYSDVDTRAGCNSENRTVGQLPQRPEAKNFLFNRLGGKDLVPLSQASFPPSSPFHMSLGVEKNPWFLAYVGVRAQTSPRELFWPMGAVIDIQATSFAKPFGGRMGPWHQTAWPRGAPQSTGPQIDSLLPGRTNSSGLLDDPNDSTRLPNYSRFPGDTLGLQSRLAQGSLRGLRTTPMLGRYVMPLRNSMVAGAANDILSWDHVTGQPPALRNYELTAISPDLFDLAYYSVEPNYVQNYYSRIRANKNLLNIPNPTPIRSDLGEHPPNIPAFSVEGQIQGNLTSNLWLPSAFWWVRDQKHLLNSWAPGPGTNNYPQAQNLSYFGQCQYEDSSYANDRVPGSCVALGGRVGYSVKLIARDALIKEGWRMKGQVGAPGPILNPPNSLGW